MTKVDEVAHCADHAFEAAQRAFSIGNVEVFRAAAQQHRGLAELFAHLRQGGRIQ